MIAFCIILLVCLTLTSIAFMALTDYGIPGPRAIYNTLWRDIRVLFRFMRMKIFLRICEMRNGTVPYHFTKAVQRNPYKVCFMYEDQTWTFQQVEDFSNRIANVFEAQGYRKGDEVSLFMENRPEFVCVWLGLSKIGVVTALINTNQRLNALAHSFNVIKCKAIIYGVGLSSVLQDALPFLENKDNIQFFSYGNSSDTGVSLDVPSKALEDVLKGISIIPPDPTKCNIYFGDKCLYIYTSGTTGLPKAAIMSHRKVIWYAAVCNYLLQMSDSDVIYNTLPLYHSAGGAYMVSFVLTFGASMAIRKKFSASNFWADAIKYNATVAQYIGEICRYLLAQPVKPEDTMHNIKLMSGNGLRSQIWTEFTERFNVKHIAELYGATESNSNILNIFSKVGAVGFTSRIAPWAYPVSIIKIDKETGMPLRDERGLCIRCKPGEPGELVGKVVMNDPSHHFDGYADPKATEKKIIRDCFRKGDAAFLSGDILVMDEDGYFYFVDRTGDTFRWKGENVSTNEVESTISKVLGLVACVVYGVQVPGTEGRACMAAIQKSDGIDLTTCYDTFRQVLAPYSIPLFIRMCEDIEATGTYKLRKVEMQKEGFNPDVVKDPLYFLDPSTHSFVPLNQEIYQQIVERKVRL